MKRTIPYILALMAWLAAAGGLHAQAVLADDTIALGDQTVVSGRFDRLDGDIVLLRQSVDSVSGEQQAVVTCFEPGVHWIHVGDFDSLPLVVTDVEVDTASAEIRDIAPLARVPYTFWEIFRWVLLALLLAAAGVAVWWVITHRQRLQQVLGMTEAPDTRTPAQRALDRLELLRDNHLWQNGKTKEYHTELTDTVRRFIEESTGIRATDMTSDETVAAVEGGGWTTEAALLRGIFATADLVKFAKSEPLPHEHEASMAKSVEVVNTLWEKVKPQEEEVKDA